MLIISDFQAMKNLQIIIFALFAYGTCNAQVTNPDLFNQTWYLHEVCIELGSPLYLQNWLPYSPFVIIDESLDFSGEGLCNTFTGTLESTSPDFFQTIVSNVTTNICVDPGNYEPIFIGPFGYVSVDGFWAQITDDPDGFQTLAIGTPIFEEYLYRNTPVVLGVNAFEKKAFSLYPNPTQELLNFQYENVALETISIFSASGAKVLQVSIDSSNSINLSALNKGLYFVEITHSEGTEVHKIIKE